MKESWKNPSINLFGEHAILISWKGDIDENLLYFVLEIKKKIYDNKLKLKLEVINTYDSLLINYRSVIDDFYTVKKQLKKLISSIEIQEEKTTQLFTLPVCYEEEFGLDLDEVSKQNGLSKSEIISLHTAPIYTVYFMGFLPGFLYLGELDHRLEISRKKEPRLSVEKGAVGLAEKQTGIYPQKSAGGWQIIGNCPLPLFDVFQDPPMKFKAGDRLKFQSISKGEYEKLINHINKGNYNLVVETVPL